MKTIIIDDERLARKELSTLLNEHKNIDIVGEAVNVDDAFEKITVEQPDLIFLDIQMPEKSGFDLLQMLDKAPQVIFTTAYDEFAIKAFEVNALDYLLKPIDPNRLREAIQKVQIPEQEGAASESIERLNEDDQVFVKDGDKCWFVPLSSVRLFESEGNYVRVYFENNKPLILKSLNNLDKRLSEKVFFRANRKHIINLKWVVKVENWFNGGLMAILKEGEKIEISRRQAVKLKEMMSL